jgi:hypothetical protein
MKKIVFFLVAGLTVLVLAGCASNQASGDNSRVRTGYTASADVNRTGPGPVGWTAKPPSDTP